MKHWQLFILMFGVPYFIQFIGMGFVMQDVLKGIEDNQMNLKGMAGIFKMMPAVIALFMFFIYGWYFSIVNGLKNKLPEGVRINTTLFNACLLITGVTMIGFLYAMVQFMAPLFESLMVNVDQPELMAQRIEEMNLEMIKVMANWIPFIIPLYFVMIGISIYLMYTVAKTYKAVELQKPVRFGDFVGEFFLVWFYFIGVWIMQPKINEFNSENLVKEDLNK